MCPVTQIFGISVSTYSIMIIIGFAAGLVCAVLRRKINEIRADDLVACLFIAAAGALLGGKLFYMIQGFPQFLELARETGYTVLEYFRDAGLDVYKRQGNAPSFPVYPQLRRGYRSHSP